ncbi:MAG TPA: hypothetical protein VIK10_07690 [Prolixibacteraceae bacterium]
MNRGNNPIDQLFKEKLGNLEENPPVSLLSRINEDMISQRKVRRINQVKTIMGIAAALVLALMAGWFTFDQKQVKQNSEASTSFTKASPDQLAVNQKNVNSSIAVKSNKSKGSVKSANKSVSPAKDAQFASLEKVNEQQAAEKPKEESAANQAKKEPSADWLKNQPKNQQYYSGNNEQASSARKTSSTINLWSIKAEISQTFTAMLSGTSTPGTDTKSLNTVGTGMMASYKVSGRVTISSGIRFSQMKQGSHSAYSLNQTAGIIYLQPVEKSGNLTRDVSVYLPSVSSIVYSNGMAINGSNVFVSDISQELKYLEIPIQATYKLIDKKFTVGVTGGLSSNFLIGNTASIVENGITLSHGNTDNIRNVLYSGSAGVEFGYDLGNKLILTVEPRIKQFMHSVSVNEMVNIRPMQLGIFTGIAYTF